MYKILAKLPFRTNKLVYLPSCHSTNETAHQLLQSGEEEGTIVITDNQIAGKGLAGNKWEALPGHNLTFSLILKPKFLIPKEQFNLTMAVSLAIKDVLDHKLPGEIRIKWPNDIYFNNKKLAGLLIENTLRGNSIESCVVGIGINVNQVEFPDEYNAISMARITGDQHDLNEQLNILLSGIGYYYLKLKNNERVQLRKQFHSSLLGIGELRKFRDSEGDFEGEIKGTDEFGRLLIKKNSDIQTYQHKQVEMLF